MTNKFEEEILTEVWKQHIENKDYSHELVNHFCRSCLDLLLKLYKQKVREAIEKQTKEILKEIKYGEPVLINPLELLKELNL